MADRRPPVNGENKRIRSRDLSFLNASELVARLSGVFENSPWVVQTVAPNGPYSSLEELFGAMREAVRNAPEQRRVALLSAHPELAGKRARAGEMNEFSTEEQGGAGLDSLEPDEYARFDDLNNKYRKKFGFPFIIAVRGHNKQSILLAFEERLAHNRRQELEVALQQVFKIAHYRLEDLITDI